MGPAHFPAKHALRLDPRADAGSPPEHGTMQRKMERIPIPLERKSLERVSSFADRGLFLRAKKDCVTIKAGNGGVGNRACVRAQST